MLFGKLFHAAIRTGDLDATVRFYTEVLGMVVAPRPPIGFPGAWLKPAQPDSEPTIHVYAGDAARDHTPDTPTTSTSYNNPPLFTHSQTKIKKTTQK